jgi:hypothetical protein
MKPFANIKFCLLIILVACQEGKPLFYELSVNPGSVVFRASADTAIIHLESNYRWTVTGVPSWLSVYPTSGDAGGCTVSLSVLQNSAGEGRLDGLKFISGESSTYVQLFQLPEGAKYFIGHYIYLSSSRASAPSAGLDISFSIISDIRYTCFFKSEHSGEWASYSIDSNRVALNIKKNHTGYDREGTLVFQSVDNRELRAEFQILQSQNDTLIVTPSEFRVKGTNNVITVEVLKNFEEIVNYSISCPGGEVWIFSNETPDSGTKTFGSNTFSFSIARNTSANERTGYIHFTDQSGSCSQKVPVIQEGYDHTLVDIEDPVFKAYLLEWFDANGDGEITLTEAEKITLINVQGRGIRSLKGIECFPNLRFLNGADNCISSLDLTENKLLEEIYCGNNNLTELNLKECKLLRILSIYNNRLTTLDFPTSQLEFLNCLNNKLADMDLSNAEHIESLICENNNIQRLILNNCIQLETVLANYNTALSEISLENCQNLKILKINKLERHGNLSFLDCSHCPELRVLYCCFNGITSLNIDRCVKLTDLDVFNNDLTELDISNNPLIDTLSLATNKLTELDLSYCTHLKGYWGADNQIRILDFSNCPEIKEIYCFDNSGLSTLNISGCNNIARIHASWCNIDTLSFKGCRELESAELRENPFTSLDFTDCVGLEELNCEQCVQLNRLYLHHIPTKFTYTEWGTSIYLPSGEYYYSPAIWVNGVLKSRLY